MTWSGFAASLLPALALASPAGHEDPVVRVLLTLALVLVAGKLGGHLAARFKQPEVLGELVAGIVLGNLGLLKVTALDFIKDDPVLGILAGIGVVLLLFEVGLESTVGDMLKVGGSSLAVAIVGIVAPAALGYAVGAWLLPESSAYLHVFLGATLSATSVGITARVLQELGRSRDTEARIVLGAAVIDDVLGLLVLAAVSGAVAAAAAGASLSLAGLARIAGLAAGFLLGAIFIGRLIAPRLFGLASRLRAGGALQATALAFCFALAGLAGVFGLAPIVGAFAAGLLLEDVHFRGFGERASHELEAALKPIVAWLAPFFFVQMGTRVELASFARLDVLLLAAMLTLAAIAGKLACSLAVRERGLNRLAIGIGMVPRGEVGLIFAQIGQSLELGGQPLIGPEAFSAVVVMVVVTTLVTPTALQWAFTRSDEHLAS